MKLRLALALSCLALPVLAQSQDVFTLYKAQGGAVVQDVTTELGYYNHKTFSVSDTIVCPSWANVVTMYQPSPTTALVLAKANGVGAPTTNANVTNGSDWHPLHIGTDLTKQVNGSPISYIAVWTNTSPSTVYYGCGV